MSDNEGNKAGKGWTDRQRLAYFFNLVEFSNIKLDFANAPRPDGKSTGACRIMVDRLKGTLKTEIAALRGDGSVGGETTTSSKKVATTPRKRKVVAAKEADSTPSKRGWKKKGEESDGEQEEGVKKEAEMEDESA